MTKDLTKNKNCYTYYLSSKLNQLESEVYNEQISVDEMKNHVLQIAEPANMTPAKANFVSTVESMSTKEGLFRYVVNAVAKASKYSC